MTTTTARSRLITRPSLRTEPGYKRAALVQPVGWPAVTTFAHQGGWDEFLYFLIPVLVGLFLLRRIERRRRLDRAEGNGDDLSTADDRDRGTLGS